ncbi:Acyltransferase family protein [compost metagenome]
MPSPASAVAQAVCVRPDVMDMGKAGLAGPLQRDATAMDSAFRGDINALRAWAVVAVVLYHFQVPGFSSGFVGVDIFFVISGYLITGQALAQMAAGRFSFSAFWTARLRRIFPALLAVIVTTLALGWWLTMPDEFLRHTRQMLFAVTFLSNITFGDARGYFDAAAHTKPLLHTWSLSIEWQFYLLLPLFLAAIWRVLPAPKKPARMTAALLVVALGSMVWCFWLARGDAGAAFFSLNARAWELLAGGVIAGLHRLPGCGAASVFMHAGGEMLRRVLVLLGWLMVGLAAVCGLSSEYWPGLWTLLPVAGSALVVWGGPIAPLKHLTGSAPVQRIGDWSYSIYLWHWPLWVFLQQWASYRDISVEAPYKIGALVVALLLSYLSYRHVEQPARLRRALWTPRRLWLGYLLALAVLTVFTLAAVKFHGFPSRVPDYQQRVDLARRTNTPRDECFRNAQSEKRAREQFCEFGAAATTQMPSAILWGDSLANQYLEPISAGASHLGLRGLIATESGCRAYLLANAGPGNTRSACDLFNQEVLAVLDHQLEPRIVILARNWGGVDSVAEEFALVRHLIASGKTVVLILPLLNPGFDVPERWMREQFRAGGPVDELRIKATPELLQQEVRDEIARQSQAFAGNPRFLTVDLAPRICNPEYCYLVKGGYANFRDTLHISNVNASQYNDIFAKVLDAAVNASLGPPALKNAGTMAILPSQSRK